MTDDPSVFRHNGVRVFGRVEVTGDVVKFRTTFADSIRTWDHKRGSVKGFSAAARKRMLEFVHSLDWAMIPVGLFISLTYPDEVGFPGHKIRKQQRYVFFRSMENHLHREVGALWRIEWKTRLTGSRRGCVLPHFHMIVPNVSFISMHRIRDWWRQAIGHVGPHLCTDVKRLNDKRHHHVYIAKYCAKAPDPSLDSLTKGNIDGRHWGLHRPALIPRHETTVYAGLSPAQIDTLQCIAYEMFPWYGKHGELGWTAFGSNGAKAKLAVMECVLDIMADG